MQTFDYIISGAGSAGCVIANRLTEDPSVKVLLLEAGSRDWNPMIHIPGGIGKLFGPGVNWRFKTVPQKNLDNREIWYPQGKTLGGSSSINAMIYIRGQKEDYDNWAALGNDGWAYDDVLPYFRRSEDNERLVSEYHGQGAALVVLAFVAAGVHGPRRALLLGLGTRLQYVFLSIAVSALVAEILKYVIGRGRPFVGGKANPFNFVPFEGTGAYASLPSGHAVAAFALAFAVSALWPRLRVVMFTYAIVILLTRLVLLAHHPSDVVAGALVGTVGAMAVRYWFAARKLGFAIRADGTIVPLAGAGSGRLKRVAHGASAP